MDVPTYVTVIQVAVDVAVVLAVVVVLRSARERAGSGAGVPEAAGATLFAWLAATAALAAAGVYRPTSATLVPNLPIAIVITLGGAWVAATAIPSLRALIDQPATQPSLVALQLWRVIRVVFLVLLAQGQLPPLFALPAGLGDIARRASPPRSSPVVSVSLQDAHPPSFGTSSVFWTSLWPLVSVRPTSLVQFRSSTRIPRPRS